MFALTPTDVNECGSNPCGFNGACRDLIDEYDCDCFPDYAGERCDIGM